MSSALGAARWCRGLADADAGTLLSAVDHYRLGPRRFEVAAVTEDAGRAVADGGETKLGVRLLREARLGYEQLGAGVDVRRIDAALRRLGVRPGRRQAHQQATTGWASLTPTETEVARLVCEGFTNRRVAEQLYVSTRTVDTHVAHVFTKLDVRSRRELTERYASERTGRQS